MSKRILYTLLTLSIGLNVGVIARTIISEASRPGPGPSGPPPSEDVASFVEQHVSGITRHLDLDDSQSQAIRENLSQHAPALFRLRELSEDTSRALSEAFAAPEFDAEQFRARLRAAGRARSALDSVSAVILVNEAEVLTPEQRKKFAEVAPSLRARGEGPSPHDGPPPPDGPRPDAPPPPR